MSCLNSAASSGLALENAKGYLGSVVQIKSSMMMRRNVLMNGWALGRKGHLWELAASNAFGICPSGHPKGKVGSGSVPSSVRLARVGLGRGTNLFALNVSGSDHTLGSREAAAKLVSSTVPLLTKNGPCSLVEVGMTVSASSLRKVGGGP